MFVATPDSPHCFKHDSEVDLAPGSLPDQVLRSDRVVVEGMIPRDELLKRYSSAHLALDVYSRNPERLLAVTTRTVEYLWCGLPVIYGDYGELATLIREYEAGWVIDPGDPTALRAALEHATSDRAELERRSQNARRLVQGALSWERAIVPLERFVGDPLVQEKGVTIYGQFALEFDRIKEETGAENQRLRREVAALREEQQRHEQQPEAQAERALARSRLQEMLQEESEQHRQTAGLLERRGSELAINEQRLLAREAELQRVEGDLKGALVRLETQEGRHQERLDLLGKRLREAGRQELELRGELAACTIQLSEVGVQMEHARREAQKLEGKIASLQQQLETLLWGKVQRVLESGEYVWRRIARQAPGIAGLWARSLANNIYQAALKKQRGVTVFPGQ